MAHLYKTSEWQGGGGGLWYCNDVEDLAGVSSRWWTPVRLLGITPAEYVTMLVQEFKVDKIHFSYEHNVLTFGWKSQQAMRKYKNWINKKAREKQFYC